jgi:hypothetical protein
VVRAEKTSKNHYEVKNDGKSIGKVFQCENNLWKNSLKNSKYHIDRYGAMKALLDRFKVVL